MKTSNAANKYILIRHLRNIEGQARGIQQMIEAHRYCLGVVQQLNALTSAAREVVVMVIEDHLRGCVAQAVNDGEREAMITEMM